MTMQEVQFYSGSTACAARLYAPKRNGGNGAGVVLAHGLGGTMDAGLFEVADRLARAGFHALVFDYRFFGESGGRTRQYVSVPKQIEDWRVAIETLRNHSDVDAHRIGLWGISFSGGHVLHLSHHDADIKAVVAQAPHIDPHLSGAVGNFHRGPEMTGKLLADVKADFLARLVFGRRRMVQLVTGDKAKPSVIAAKEGAHYLKLAGPSWRNEIDVRSFVSGKLDLNNAAAIAQDLKTPTLIQMGVRDETISNEAIEHFARRAGPMARLSRYECGHFGMLMKPHFAKAMRETVEFFKQTLLV